MDYAAGNYAWRTSVDFRFTGLQPLLDSNGVRIMPDDPATPHFEVRTDSTVLLGARAAEFAGIKVRIDGEGIPGSLMIQLQDDDHTRFNPVGYNATMNYTAEQSETFIPWSSFIGPSGARIQAFPFESLVTSGTRSTPLTIQSIEPYIAPPFLDGLKNGAPRLGSSYFTWAGTGVNMAVNVGTELLEIASSNAANGTSYAIEYPKSGTILWNTSQNRYLQAWLPYVGGGDVASIQFSVDRGAFGGDVWANRIDGLITANGPNARPALIDVNALAGLSSGIQQGTGAHQLRFRFVFFNTNYSATADLNKLEATMDWVRAGMAPSVQTSVGTCGFVGPADNTSTSNPPTLQWSAPAGFGSGSYIVSYSKDPYFRGPSTVTLHNVTTTNYTPPSALAQGKWYWTVMAVNSGRVTGNALYKAFSAPDQAEAKNYIFYSFNIMP